MKNEIITQEMTQKEIDESVKLLKVAIKEKRLFYKNANPTQDNCYTSSSDIIGVYFPNTTFTKCQAYQKQESKYYEFCALSKVGGELGIIESLKDDVCEEIAKVFAPYRFTSFDLFIFGQHYKAIKKGILRDIAQYKETLNFLENIKRTTKKSGDDFQDITKNFVNVSLHLGREYFSPYKVDKITLYGKGQEITLYRKDETKEQSEEPSANEIEELIKARIKQVKDLLQVWAKDLEKLPNTFKKFERLAASLKAFKDGVNHWTYFSHELDYMTL